MLLAVDARGGLANSVSALRLSDNLQVLSARVPASCPSSSRPLTALGAVLFALVGLSACGGVPGNAVVQVDGTPITKTTFNHWLAVAAASSTATPGTQAGGARTAGLHGLHRAPRSRPRRSRRKARPRRRTAQLKSRVRTAVQVAADRGAGLPDLLAVGARRSRIAGREAHRRGSQEAVRKNQGPAVPEGRRNSKNSSPARARRSPTCCCA